MRLRPLVCLVGALTCACGGQVGDTNATEAASGGSALYTIDAKSCAQPASPDLITKELRPASYESVAVVELSVAEECTNLGGQWLLGRDVHRRSDKYWLGGHGCRTVPVAIDGTASYGVLVYRTTDSVWSVPQGTCVSFPGNASGASSSTAARVRAVATFATLAQAEAFARTVEN